MPRTKKSTIPYMDRLESEIENNQSRLSLVLGILIVIVAGILLFNYVNKNKAELGPAQNTAQQDVTPEQLPGKYTVKADDTLFNIAEKYYNNGEKYSEIAKANNLADVDQIEAGQVLEIPKLEIAATQSATTDTAVDNQWGPKITSEIYTVAEGDWLSTIAGRAYGDIMAYQKIATANNIANPDLIEPGMQLKIPR